jgi:hypothetical protein
VSARRDLQQDLGFQNILRDDRDHIGVPLAVDQNFFDPPALSGRVRGMNGKWPCLENFDRQTQNNQIGSRGIIFVPQGE